MTTETPPKPSRGLAYGLPIVVLLIGALSIVLLVTSDWLRDRLLADNRERSRALAEVDTILATTHLWVEEFVTGDDINMASVLSDFDIALATVRAIASGGTLPAGTIVRPLTNFELKAKVTELETKLAAFGELSRSRVEGYRQSQPVGVGSEIDRQYDQVFRSVVAASARLAHSLHDRHVEDQRRSQRIFNGIVAGWALLVIVAAFSFAAKERRSRQAEEALAKSEQRLLQAQKMEAVGRLAGGIAHDINNYLAAIHAQSELVQRKAEPGSRLSERMNTISTTVFRASDLIKRLLAFSRRQPSKPQVVSLNQLVTGLQGMMGQLLREDIEVYTVLAPDLWPVRVDPAQIEQILVNLLVNAREAMPEGGKVTVETRNTERMEAGAKGAPAVQGSYVLLAVSDNGPGIPAEIRDKIFEPFFTTKAESGSSGLGLATVYGIVNELGGHLWLYSEPGGGSSFKIFLPRSQEAFTARESVEPAEEVGGDERLLLVEDNQEVRASTRELLTDLGYRVTAASQGDEALTLLEESGGAFDLLITDVVMPGISGRELVQRAQERFPRLPAIYVSGYTDNAVVRHDVLAGEVEFLQKPFTSRQLARKVRERLDGAVPRE